MIVILSDINHWILKNLGFQIIYNICTYIEKVSQICKLQLTRCKNTKALNKRAKIHLASSLGR